MTRLRFSDSLLAVSRRCADEASGRSVEDAYRRSQRQKPKVSIRIAGLRLSVEETPLRSP